MTRLRMLDDILGQPASLRGTLAHHAGPGASTLAACVDLLHTCTGRILITGMGASFFAAIPAAQAMEAAGVRVHLAEAAELLHYGEGACAPGDIAVLISRSGGSIETLDLAAKLNASGIPFIAVTNISGSPLTRHARHTLEIASQPDQIIAIQTYTGTVLTLLLLADYLTSTTRQLPRQTLAALPLLKSHIDRSLAESDRWQAFFSPASSVYLLGRGGALASLREGALLFHETAKLSAMPMSSGQFRHGPVEVVSPDFHALIFGSAAPTRELDWQLAQDLRSMGGHVLWLGPQPTHAGQPSLDDLVPWPRNNPTALMPIFDIIPVQVAAYRTALWRGIRPGDFRFASEITDKETGFPFFEASLT